MFCQIVCFGYPIRCTGHALLVTQSILSLQTPWKGGYLRIQDTSVQSTEICMGSYIHRQVKMRTPVNYELRTLASIPSMFCTCKMRTPHMNCTCLQGGGGRVYVQCEVYVLCSCGCTRVSRVSGTTTSSTSRHYGTSVRVP